MLLQLATVAVLPLLAIAQSGPSCPASTLSSCPPPSNPNTCCTNSPGGYLLLTQFWTPEAGLDRFTVHGLWPDRCDGSFEAFCDNGRNIANPRQILQNGGGQSALNYMDAFWPSNDNDDEGFWSHEWNKHGTCISTMETQCYGSGYINQEEVVQYFQRTVALDQGLPTYQWLANAGITPSSTRTYSLSQLQNVARANTGRDARWGCRNGELTEVWYGYTVVGTVTDGQFNPSNPVSASSCPSTGIRYPPRTSGGTAPSTGTVFYNVIRNGATNGCLISTGKWMVGVTCAGYTINPTSNGAFTLTTSRGSCGISQGIFTCGGVAATAFTTNSNGYLTSGSQSVFFADNVPSGQTQITVKTGQSNFQIQLRAN